jgi:hypothetical protein
VSLGQKSVISRRLNDRSSRRDCHRRPDSRMMCQAIAVPRARCSRFLRVADVRFVTQATQKPTFLCPNRNQALRFDELGKATGWRSLFYWQVRARRPDQGAKMPSNRIEQIAQTGDALFICTRKRVWRRRSEAPGTVRCRRRQGRRARDLKSPRSRGLEAHVRSEASAPKREHVTVMQRSRRARRSCVNR